MEQLPEKGQIWENADIKILVIEAFYEIKYSWEVPQVLYQFGDSPNLKARMSIQEMREKGFKLIQIAVQN